MPLWTAIPAWYALASLATFVAYALDKRAATRGSWRTRETTLHLLALAGGWPGALAGQRVLRHKSRKTRFKIVLWLIVGMHVGVWAGALYLWQR